jgi:hypothetical protein
VRALDPDEVPPLPTNPEPFIKTPADASQRGDLGRQLDGAAGVVDAPPRGQPK